MSRNNKTDCCEYQEERRRLALKTVRKYKTNGKKDAPNVRIDDCDEDDEEIEEKRKCEEKRVERIEKVRKTPSPEVETMGRIKPTMEERNKYSMDSRHIRCFLEAAEIDKLENEKKALRISKREPCYTDEVSDTRRKKTKGTRPMGKKQKEKEDKEKDDDESKYGADHQRVNDDESGREKDEQIENGRMKGGREKSIEDEFWCSKVKKKVDSKLRDGWQDEINCRDSICSFDSEINLSGLLLTKEDMKKIAETRRGRMISPAVESEKTIE